MKKIIVVFVLCLASFFANAQCSINITAQSPAVCANTCNGFISLTFSGGVMPYNLYVDNGTNTLGPFTVTAGWQFANLCPGNYTLTLIDANNDTCYANFNITTLPVPIAQYTVSNATPGFNDGCITINTITGGTAPFIFLWSTGSTSQNVCFLSAGVYTLWITDANGCSSVDTIVVGVGSNGLYTLTGLIYYDLNSNGTQDSGEPGMVNQQAVVTPGPATAISGVNGNYGVVAAPGTYDITYQPVPGWHLTSTPASYNQTVTTTSIGGNDFGVFPDSTSASATVFLISGFPRCFWDVPYHITIYNSGYTILNGTVSFTHDPLHTYVSSSLTPTSQVGNTLTYSFSNLFPGQYMVITVTLTEPAGGTGVFSTASLSASDIFSNQITSNAHLQQTVSCSYDPNDKQFYNPNLSTLNQVSMDDWLTYQIRFQNTGNDTAFTVVIIDTLDANFDLNTFTLLGSSHPVITSIRNGNEVSFVFDNILLPDSNVNEPASHGYVLYRIKGLASTPDPTTVSNTAYIYFDLNSPIQTNNTIVLLSDSWLGTAEQNNQDLFELFPNPGTGTYALQIKDGSGDNEVIVSNSIGQEVDRFKIQNSTTHYFDIKGSSGVYFITLISDKKVSSLKLIKL